MGRSVFLTLILTLLVAMMPTAAWSASSAASASFASASSATAATAACTGGDFQAKLRCWRGQAEQGKRVEVTLRQPLRLGSVTDAVNWTGYRSAFSQDRLAVSVPGGQESGDGGTVLLILAGERHVAPDSKITTLSATTLRPLRSVCDDLCGIVGGVAGQKTVNGKALLDSRVAAGIPESSGGTPWGIVFLLALVLLLALLGVAVLRTRRLRFSTGFGESADSQVVPHESDRPGERPEPAERRPAARRHGRQVAVPLGPWRTAIVCSDLHPQGYVEVDRCLFRAVWADHQAPAPGLGASVDVVQGVGQDSNLLLALPPGTRH